MPAPTTPGSWRATRLAAVAGFTLALGVRLAVLAHAPVNYSFDAYQRWAGRDHLLVQGWLPVTQAILAGVAAVGGDDVAARAVLGLVASVGVGLGCLAAGRLAGPVAAWAFVVAATYGPFVVWSVALYQEGTFLAVIFGCLALVGAGRLRAADVLLGLAGLVRYEAWPCILLWWAWRREATSLVAGWGPLVWIGGHVFLGWRGHASSPIDFDDWESLLDRLQPGGWLHDAERLLLVARLGGGLAYGMVAAVGVAWWGSDRRVRLVASWVVAQALVTAGWLAGLETATQRMLVLPVVLSAFCGSLAVARAWERWPRLRPALVGGMVLLFTLGALDAWRQAGFEQEKPGPEVEALAAMRTQCPTCVWWVVPRTGLGTRARHDGCEVFQGITPLRHGTDFWCAPWVPEPEARARRTEATGTVRWRGRAYMVSVEPPG